MILQSTVVLNLLHLLQAFLFLLLLLKLLERQICHCLLLFDNIGRLYPIEIFAEATTITYTLLVVVDIHAIALLNLGLGVSRRVSRFPLGCATLTTLLVR